MQIGVLLPQRHKWVLPAICCTAADCKSWSARAHGPLRAHDADRCFYANEMCSNQGWRLWGRARFPEHMSRCWCPAVRMPLSADLIREHGIRFGAECGEAVLTAVLQMRWEMICLMWGGSVFQLLFWAQGGLGCPAVCCFSLKVICSIRAINTSIPWAGDRCDVHWCTAREHLIRFWNKKNTGFFVPASKAASLPSREQLLKALLAFRPHWARVQRLRVNDLVWTEPMHNHCGLQDTHFISDSSLYSGFALNLGLMHEYSRQWNHTVKCSNSISHIDLTLFLKKSHKRGRPYYKYYLESISTKKVCWKKNI